MGPAPHSTNQKLAMLAACIEHALIMPDPPGQRSGYSSLPDWAINRVQLTASHTLGLPLSPHTCYSYRQSVLVAMPWQEVSLSNCASLLGTYWVSHIQPAMF
jgi:hypothetical protein